MGAEQCDDGNQTPNDGCSNCIIDPGWQCFLTVCNVTCGDSIIILSKECEDGNFKSGDGCSSDCRVETGWACSGVPSRCASLCGDGLKVGQEECDDGNQLSGDFCDSSCKIDRSSD